MRALPNCFRDKKISIHTDGHNQKNCKFVTVISVTEHIRYLLTRHECVIVPGWGAFVAQHVGARVSASGTELLAPTRVLGFNPEVAHNDGLLASGIARREGISYDAAVALIANEVSVYFHRVDVLGELVMPRIGRFLKSDSGAMLFEPDEDAPIVTAAYMGLPNVSVRQLAELPSTAEEQGESEHILRVAPRRWVSVAKVAASVAVLLGMGALLSTPVLVDDTTTDYASVVSPKFSAPKSAGTIVRELSNPIDSTLTFALPAVSDSTSVAVKAKVAAEPRCYLVIASCETRRRAEKYIARSGEQGLKILERDGRYRVYIATGRNVAEAGALKTTDADFARRHPDAWVYSR